MKNKITHQLFFPQPPEEVWEYLTRPELMELWLMKSDFESIVGKQFRFMSKPAPQIDFDGFVYCTVMEVVPGKRLAYSWKCGPGDGLITVDSVVEWTLLPRNGGTELLLEHGSFKDARYFAIVDAMDAGWLRNMQKIGELLNDKTHGTTNA